jgi:riboflavin synthase
VDDVFTGLIEDQARVVRAEPRPTPDGDGLELVLLPDALPAAELALGESIAVDGCCLTVTARDAAGFTVLAGPETLRRTTASALRPGARVNLERALLPTTRMGGHIVAGHVDGVGEIAERRPLGPGLELAISAPREILRYVVEKGSIAVDGISLTVNHVAAAAFSLALIPHTIEKTSLAGKTAGARVNLEVDIVGKYVERFVKELR